MLTNRPTGKPVGFMQSWNCTSHFKSHLLLIWNEMCYLKLFETWVAYLKLSDETWNKICYLKFLKLETLQTCHCSSWFEIFRWDLKKRCNLNFWNPSWGLLIWNFKMRLEMRCAIWNLKLFNPSQELVIWNFQMRLEMRHAIWNFSTFSNTPWELLIWNFQIRLEKEVLFEIFEAWNFSNPSQWVAYLKLSDETWTRGAIWNFWNLKLCSWNYLKLLTCPLRTKKFQLTLNLEVINVLVHRVDICC